MKFYEYDAVFSVKKALDPLDPGLDTRIKSVNFIAGDPLARLHLISASVQ